MSKTSKVCMTVLILLTIVNVFLSFNNQPDIHLWNWFGYQFGISFDLLPLKIAALGLIGILIYDNQFKKSLSN